ncbi:MAG: class I SAM-dependent methyltransferase [Candidatus Nanopelagicaceae bacterium]
MTRADLNKEPDDVSRMFDRVARRYDLLNDLLSLGQTKRWRNSVTKLISPKPGMKILDIAAGTGASSAPLAKAGADVTALDFSEGMLEEGRRLRPEITFIHGDALALGFANSTFDVTTISFGLRNTHDISKALSEALRVTKENGAIYVVEFSHPTSRIFRSIYLKYLMRLLPRVARIFTHNPEAYDYLAESIIAWPNQADLAEIMAKSGWREVRWENLTFGVVAVHTARK